MLDSVILLQSELMIYACAGYFLFGIDDLLVDLVWLVKRPDKEEMLAPRADEIEDQSFAIFVPAWEESSVIGTMLHNAAHQWHGENYRIFVGTYANDPETRAAARTAAHPQIEIVTLRQNGPTTKADCLNSLVEAAFNQERKSGKEFDGFIIHDAEDLVDPAELQLFARHIAQADMVQIPVIPNPDARSRFVAGHYLDEFAEAHLKELPVRQLLGASVPSAGTGCALSRRALAALTTFRGAHPFDPHCMVEDYEMGLTLGALGLTTCFVRARRTDGSLVAVRSSFPASLSLAVRQKSRWIAGIALAGWDRTRWSGRAFEHWMRWRDRRSLFAATFIMAGYSAVFLAITFEISGVRFRVPLEIQPFLLFNFLLLFWRAAFRGYATCKAYGWREGLLAPLRMSISSVIAVLASIRGLRRYLTMIRTGKIEWEKTTHAFLMSNLH